MSDERFPIFNGEPFSSLLGVMRFPDDPQKAETYACWWLTDTGNHRQLGDDANRIAQRGAGLIRNAEDVRNAEVGGTAVGSVTNAMFQLIAAETADAELDDAADRPKRAMWTDAVYALETTSKQLQISRSQIEQYRRDFRRVFHFWGAEYNLKQCSLGAYDVRTLCDRAEMILQVFRKWNTRRDSFLLSTEFYRSHWHPPRKVLMADGKGLLSGHAPHERRRGRPGKIRPRFPARNSAPLWESSRTSSGVHE